jgi:hypothetical protein
MVPARHRHLVDVAAEVLADEAQNLGITYSGFCLTAGHLQKPLVLMPSG